MTPTAIADVQEVLNEVREDTTVPKNVREKMDMINNLLSDSQADNMKISKVLHELETIAEDVNLQSYTRTQIWNIVSALEAMQ